MSERKQNGIMREHIQVLKTLYDSGKITKHSMKSLRGQISRMATNEEREEYLKKIIKRTANRNVGMLAKHTMRSFERKK